MKLYSHFKSCVLDLLLTGTPRIHMDRAPYTLMQSVATVHKGLGLPVWLPSMFLCKAGLFKVALWEKFAKFQKKMQG